MYRQAVNSKRAALVIAAGFLAVGCGSSPDSLQSELGADTAAETRRLPTNEFSQPQPPEDTPRAGAISRSQAERPGVEARTECSSQVVRSFVETLSAPGTEVRSLASFLTDSRGVTAWGDETLGAGIPIGADPSEFADEVHALCYFQGEFIVSDASIDENAPPFPARFLVVDAPQTPTGSPRLLQTTVDTMAVVAPPPPDPSLQVGAYGGRSRVTPEQPPGVRYRD